MIEPSEYAQLIIEEQQDGIKHDKGKPNINKGFLEYFPRAIEEVAKVSVFGAEKYDWGNWRLLEDAVSRYQDANLRHLTSVAKGEEIDSESGFLHLAHAAWNALAVLELKLKENVD